MRTSPEDIVAMATFARVVEAKSFTDAARSLGISKSVVSARVSRLEERLGVCLLHRTTRRLALTADGVRLYERCARVVAAADEAAQSIDDASEPPRGVLRAHLPLAFAQAQLARPIAELAQLYPNVTLDLKLDDRVPDLAREGLDVAIVMAERLSDASLVARKLASDTLVVCAAPGYLRRRGIPFRPQDLIHHTRISYSSGRRDGTGTMKMREWEFTTDEGPLALDSATMIADSMSFVRDAALAEHGIAMLPYSIVAADLAAGRLHRLLDDFHDHRFGIHAVHLHTRFVPARVRVFVDHLAAYLRKPPWTTSSSAESHAPAQSAKHAEPSRRRKGRIPITAQDVRRLTEVASVYREVDAVASERLLRTLERTEIVAPSRMPRVVTMNSRCIYRDASGRQREASLVYPWDVGNDSARISILSPLGNAMLGAPIGEELPTGWRVEAIPYQPEAAGDHHL